MISIVECVLQGVISFPQPLGLIKNMYDDSDSDESPCFFFQIKKVLVIRVLHFRQDTCVRIIRFTYDDKNDLEDSTSLVATPV